VEAKQDYNAENEKGHDMEATEDDDTKIEKNGDANVENDDLNAQTETPEALPHMRLLNELLTNDLGRALKLRQGVETGTARTVFFPDLWHVFRYGQEVRSSGSKKHNCRLSNTRQTEKDRRQKTYNKVGLRQQNFPGIVS
jgi:hypothetical protein